MSTGVTWTRVHKPQWNQRRNERKNKEQLESLGMKFEGDGGQDVAHLEEIKRINRREVLCDSWSRRVTQSSSFSHETMTEEEGVECSRWERKEADKHWGEIKDGEFKKLENKEGINETHQHDRAITAGVKVSKILEISHLIVFNPFSGHAGLSPSSHYRLYCANEPIRHSLVLTSSFLVLIFIYLLQIWVTKFNANLGRTT